MSSAVQNEAASSPYAPVTFDQLSENSRGLLCLTGGVDGLVFRLVSQNRDDDASSLLAALGEVFPERLYVQLWRHTSNDDSTLYKLVRSAQDAKLSSVATHNIYYTHTEQANIQRLLTGIRLNKEITQLNQASLAPPQAYFPGTADMQARFYHYPQALTTSMEIADRCNLELPLGETHYPEIELENNQTPIQLLKTEALKGRTANGTGPVSRNNKPPRARDPGYRNQRLHTPVSDHAGYRPVRSSKRDTNILARFCSFFPCRTLFGYNRPGSNAVEPVF